jgi:hypothetical protein
MNLQKLLTTIRRKSGNESRSKEGVFVAERREHPRHVL